jgi:Sulfotransferase family
LGTRVIGQASLDLEELLAVGGPAPKIVQPVFIAGLARSGSSILLASLYQSRQFRSLTYRDMPFVLMSGVWRKLSYTFRTQREATERAHADRLMVDFDSPEAFEEIFWQTYCGDLYISKDRLVPHGTNKSIRTNFKKFVGHVINSRENESNLRYLSKNNNNLLRLPTIKKVFPDAIILIPFREPLQHALSLLRQHALFLQLHSEDKFSLDYMNWLGHYEFGLGHKHYVYSEESKLTAMDSNHIDYWLQCWLETYQFALNSSPADAIFLGYEQLCEGSDEVFTKLFKTLNLNSDPSMAAAYYEIAEARPLEGYNADLYDACKQVHSALLERYIKALMSDFT